MKRTLVYFTIVFFVLIVLPISVFSQGYLFDGPEFKPGVNPHPLPEQRREALFAQNDSIVKSYEGKTPSELSREELNKLLIAIARRVALLYAPVYYRESAKPLIREGVYGHATASKDRWAWGDTPFYAVALWDESTQEVFETSFLFQIALQKDDLTVSEVCIPGGQSIMLGTKEQSKKFFAKPPLQAEYLIPIHPHWYKDTRAKELKLFGLQP